MSAMSDDELARELARVKRIGMLAHNVDQVLAWRSENLSLRAQNAELLAALRRVLKAHEAILRDPSKSSTCIDTRSLIARIEAAP